MVGEGGDEGKGEGGEGKGGELPVVAAPALAWGFDCVFAFHGH